MTTLVFLAPALILSFLLVGIHSYLGLHVLKREILFVDISLSQFSVLAGVVAIFVSTSLKDVSFWNISILHNQIHLASLLTSFIFGVFISLLLSYLRKAEKSISQEAIIAMLFAVSSGLLILLLDSLPQGAENLKESMSGNILFVTWSDISWTFFIYVIVGLCHWVYRKYFWEITLHNKTSFWGDFFFYFLFFIVITFSTQHAGVLVVFSLLIAPAAIATKLTASLKKQLTLSWMIGLCSSIISFCISLKWDLPAGPTLVVFLGMVFFIFLLTPKSNQYKSLASKEDLMG